MTLYTRAAVARMLGTDRVTLAYHIRRCHVPPPRLQRGRRVFYSVEEVNEILDWWFRQRVPLGVSYYLPADVNEMKRLHAGGIPQTEIAERYGVSQATVSFLLRGKTKPGRRGGASGRPAYRRADYPAVVAVPVQLMKSPAGSG